MFLWVEPNVEKAAKVLCDVGGEVGLVLESRQLVLIQTDPDRADDRRGLIKPSCRGHLRLRLRPPEPPSAKSKRLFRLPTSQSIVRTSDNFLQFAGEMELNARSDTESSYFHTWLLQPLRLYFADTLKNCLAQMKWSSC